MNGMKAKKQRRDHDRLFDAAGLPRDPNEWTVEDWMDLHAALEWVRRRVAERHRQEDGHA